MTEQLAQIIDFAAERARRPARVTAIDARRESEVDTLRQHLGDAWKRLRAEALRLPRPWRATALAEADRVTEFDPEWPRGSILEFFEKCRRGDAEFWFDEFNQVLAVCLADLRRAVDRLRLAKRSGKRSMIAGARRMVTTTKRRLLVVLFRYGRRRIERSERPTLKAQREIAKQRWGRAL